MTSRKAVNDADTRSPSGNTTIILQDGRTFLLNIPDGYEHGQPHPLVLSFHGGQSSTSPFPPQLTWITGADSDVDQRTTHLSEPSLRIAGRPFLTAYGQGMESQEPGQGRVWQGAPYATKSVDDIKYVHDMLANILGAYTIEETRIYACGFSNGGGFVALLASHPDAPQVFAALATVCPALYSGTSVSGHTRPWRPIPILTVHGLEDADIPFSGRPEGVGWGALPDVRLWRRQWAERNGAGKDGYPGQLVQPDAVIEVHSGVWEEVWNSDSSGEVRALSVQSLGHSWPTTKELEKPAQSSEDGAFDFTEQHMVQFFSRHCATSLQES